MRTNRNRQRQALIRQYKIDNGVTDVDMHDVAHYAVRLGWELPRPTDPIDRLAAEFAQSAREEVKEDATTGRPYRVNHAYPVAKQGKNGQLYLWIDIDEAPRKTMLKSLVNRREQIVGDVVQMTFDEDHWNSVNPNEEPINMPADFTDDVEWRKNGPDAKAS